MKTKFLIALFLVFIAVKATAQNPYYQSLENLSSPPLFGSSPFQDSLWAWDTTNFQIVYRSSPVPSSGGSITGMNGITVHPCTGEIFVICKQTAVTGRTLGIFNPKNDTVSIIGNLGDNFSSISFREDGTLFGTTGDGANVPETMYEIDVATAIPTLAVALGNGADGEVIAYNRDDDQMYHWSGNGTVVYESFPATSPYTPILPISGSLGTGEIFGAVYTGGGNFLISSINSDFRILSTTGVVSATIVSTPDDIRGLAQVNRWLNLNGNDSICAGDTTILEALGGEAFQWTRDGNPVNGATSSTFVPTQTGWYNCLITTDTMNCAVADTAWFGKFIKVFALPTVGITPAGSAYICSVGDSILLTGTNGGSSQWYMDGSMLIGETTNSYYATMPGIYNMTKTNQNGCTDSSSVSTVVSYAPAGGTISPSGSDTICAPVTMIIVATPGADGYQWLNGGSIIPGEMDDSLTVSASGVYSCILDYGNCMDTTITFDLSVLDCSGLEELTGSILELYPNPATNMITVSSSEMLDGTLEFIGVDGALLYSTNISGLSITVEIDSLAKGTYVLRYRGSDILVTKHFVKL